jgi:hypothetical protein
MQGHEETFKVLLAVTLHELQEDAVESVHVKQPGEHA